MDIKFIEYEHLYNLESNIDINLINGNYYNNSPWLDEYFKHEYALSTGINIYDVTLITAKNHSDIVKTCYFQRLYEKKMSYGKKTFSSVRSRYFLGDNINRGLTTKGISRLWWMAYYTYDETYTNPYHLTKILLTKQDIASSLFSRNFTQHKHLIKYILKSLDEYCTNNEFPSKKHIRSLCKDLLKIKSLYSISYNKINSLILTYLASYKISH